MRAWRSYHGFEGRSSMRTWLYRIATNACLTAIERRGRRPLPSGLEAGQHHAVLVDGRPSVPSVPRATWIFWVLHFVMSRHSSASCSGLKVARPCRRRHVTAHPAGGDERVGDPQRYFVRLGQVARLVEVDLRGDFAVDAGGLGIGQPECLADPAVVRSSAP